MISFIASNSLNMSVGDPTHIGKLVDVIHACTQLHSEHCQVLESLCLYSSSSQETGLAGEEGELCAGGGQDGEECCEEAWKK